MNIEAILGIVVIIVGGIIFFLGSRKSSESSKLSTYVSVDTITSIPLEMPVVVTGTVAADQPLSSPVTKKSCVYYQYLLEREEETKTKAGNSVWVWKQVGPSQTQSIPFYLQDKSGKILVKPDNCEVSKIYRTQQFLEPGTIQNVSQNLSKGLQMLADAFQFDTPENQANGTRERVTEDAIFIGADLNVFGILTVEGNQKFFQKTNDYPLILSPLSKTQLVGSEKKNSTHLLCSCHSAYRARSISPHTYINISCICSFFLPC